MGRIAVTLADETIVTSDNPRSESPEAIVAEILTGVSETERTAHAVVDRRQAIREAVALARRGDVVVLAGKGHETYQEIAGVKHPFDDRLVAKEAIAALERERGA